MLPRYTAAVDWFGLGVLIGQILMCGHVYNEVIFETVLRRIQAGKPRDAARLLLNHSRGNPKLVTLCVRLMSPDPKMRPGGDEVEMVLEQVLKEAMAAEQAAARKAEEEEAAARKAARQKAKEAAAAAFRKEREEAMAEARRAIRRALAPKVSREEGHSRAVLMQFGLLPCNVPAPVVFAVCI